MHWAKRKAIVDIYDVALIEYRNLRLDPPVHLRFDFTFAGRALDPDNCAFMQKELVDSMRRWGIIANDTPGYISGITITSEKGARDEVRIHSFTCAELSSPPFGTPSASS